ncbi:HAD family hydrolase [Antribacter gilvus]|uniref:HAD family hydrolase n=1 Tax=Antribacter gilvus TaxID=2304675 RepID=UPI0013DF8EF7|nr:HAD family hydrolase [Antribacter gilvus]
MIWLFDLDNTLVDRDGAFRDWAAKTLADAGRPASALAEVLRADAGGFAPKPLVAQAILDATGRTGPVAEMIEEMRAGIRAHVVAYPDVAGLLAGLRAAGDRIGIVTNGDGTHQRAKLGLAGLTTLVDAVVVSGEVGFAKPDPRTVRAALGLLGAEDADPSTVWMIGDAAHADVAVGHASGVRTGWVSHGRTWSGEGEPDVVGKTTHDVVAQVQARA